jgi:hypothetical protein
VGERKKPDYGFGFCRECGAQYKRGGSGAKYCAAHRAAHREELAAKTRAYYAEHREELAAKKRAYRAAHREETAAKMRAYHAAHREEIVAKKRARRQIAGLLKLMVAADAARRVMDVQQQQTKG